MPILEYTKWQNFKTVLLKAQIACENSGNDPADHFTDASKMVAIGSDAKREVEDMHLSRYACYLVVQNADPAKEVVALGLLGESNAGYILSCHRTRESIEHGAQ